MGNVQMNRKQSLDSQVQSSTQLIAINKDKSSLDQVLQKTYKFSKYQIQKYTHHFTVWESNQNRCEQSVQDKNCQTQLDQFTFLQQPIQFFSDQVYIILHIYQINNKSKTFNPYKATYQTFCRFIPTILSLKSVQQLQFSDCQFIMPKNLTEILDKDIGKNEKQHFYINLSVLAGKIANEQQKSSSIKMMKKLEQHLKRSQGYLVRQIFNGGSQWKPNPFYEKQYNLVNTGIKQYKNPQCSGSNKSDVFDLKQFQDKCVNKFGLFKCFYEMEFSSEQKVDQLSIFSKKNREGKIKQTPFVCDFSEINPNQNQIPGIQEQSKFIYHVLTQSDNFQLKNKQTCPEKLIEISKSIFLGNYEAAKNYELLQKNRIKLIINCAPDQCKNWFLQDFDYKWYFLFNQNSNKLKQENISSINDIACLVYQAYESIQKAANFKNASNANTQKANIMIHCYQDQEKVAKGQIFGERSLALITGMLMLRQKMNFEEALYKLKIKFQTLKIQEVANALLGTQYQAQLQQLHQRRRKAKLKLKDHLNLFAVSSFSKYAPQYLVAKHIATVSNQNQLFSIQYFKDPKSAFLIASSENIKIVINPECQSKKQYLNFAQNYAKILQKYESYGNAVQIDYNFLSKQKNVGEVIKTIRNQKLFLLKLNSPESNKQKKQCGFKSSEKMTFRYPILRPIFEQRKQDGYYFVIRQLNGVARVNMMRGQKWIGYEQDKDQFFDRLVSKYLSHIRQDKILVQQDAECSIINNSDFC